MTCNQRPIGFNFSSNYKIIYQTLLMKIDKSQKITFTVTPLLLPVHKYRVTNRSSNFLFKHS